MRLLFITFFSIATSTLIAQVRYQQIGEAQTTISGTSTLHDWSMTSKTARYAVVLEVDEGGMPIALRSLSYSIECESLKSGHSAMDKNAYSTLNTDEFKSITFTLTEGKVAEDKFQCEGTLTIAGTTKPVSITARFKVLPTGAISCTATQQLKMSDYGIDPPVFMFGTIRTGDEITVNFSVVLRARP